MSSSVGIALRSAGAPLTRPSADTRQFGCETSSVKERPILFKGEMVRAILAGQKTQTRRVMKPQPSAYVPSENKHPTNLTAPYFDAYNHGPYWCWWAPDNRQGPDWIKCPYGIIGDRLWVKETWRPVETLSPWDVEVIYQANGEHRLIKDGEFGDADWKWPKAAARGNVTPLFMPRWASRIALEITDIRVERLNDISEADAEAEGLHKWGAADCDGDPRADGRLYSYHLWNWREPHTEDDGFGRPSLAYASLWESINGAGSWDANPWVWVVEFSPLPVAPQGASQTPSPVSAEGVERAQSASSRPDQKGPK